MSRLPEQLNDDKPHTVYNKVTHSKLLRRRDTITRNASLTFAVC